MWLCSRKFYAICGKRHGLIDFEKYQTNSDHNLVFISIKKYLRIDNLFLARSSRARMRHFNTILEEQGVHTSADTFVNTDLPLGQPGKNVRIDSIDISDNCP
jgi:hypothetical protein